jgi:Tfp pilus assembly protein PilN
VCYYNVLLQYSLGTGLLLCVCVTVIIATLQSEYSVTVQQQEVEFLRQSGSVSECTCMKSAGGRES